MYVICIENDDNKHTQHENVGSSSTDSSSSNANREKVCNSDNTSDEKGLRTFTQLLADKQFTDELKELTGKIKLGRSSNERCISENSVKEILLAQFLKVQK